MSIPDQILFECDFEKNHFAYYSEKELSILIAIAKKSHELGIEKLDINTEIIKKYIKENIEKPKAKDQKQIIKNMGEQVLALDQKEFENTIKKAIEKYDPIKLGATDDKDKVKKLSIKDVAYDFFCQALFSYAGLNIFPDVKIKEIKPKTRDRISLLIKQGDWLVVKKKKIDKKTYNWEIVGIFASIIRSTYEKYFVLNEKYDKIFEQSEEFKKKRRSLKNLGLNLLEVGKSKYKGPELNLLLYLAAKQSKFSPILNAESLVKAYPDLKIKKPKGRMKK